jgi:hypothetical protein
MMVIHADALLGWADGAWLPPAVALAGTLRDSPSQMQIASIEEPV